ncbi:MAG TPA: hypothetical protein VN887_20385 [Candidatus Angelobacter sp.]|nr:hypothetical protein [Candidatus Angelobacter sp.]
MKVLLRLRSIPGALFAMICVAWLPTGGAARAIETAMESLRTCTPMLQITMAQRLSASDIAICEHSYHALVVGSWPQYWRSGGRQFRGRGFDRDPR